MTRGHIAMGSYDVREPERCPKVLAKAEHTKYLVFPTSYKFHKVVRILSSCLKFIRAFRAKCGSAIVKRGVSTAPPVHFNSFLLSDRSLWPICK